MRVILLEDVENVGKKYEVKEVKNGYARNFLIPKGLVKPATAEALKWLEVQKEIEEKKAEEELTKAETSASKIEGVEVIIPVKVGEEGQLFERITPQKISEKLRELGFDIKKNQINLAQPIGEIGEHQIKIKFEHNLESEITVIITEEKS